MMRLSRWLASNASLFIIAIAVLTFFVPGESQWFTKAKNNRQKSVGRTSASASGRYAGWLLAPSIV